jgi:hypothetical protein
MSIAKNICQIARHMILAAGPRLALIDLRRRQIEGYALGASFHALEAAVFMWVLVLGWTNLDLLTKTVILVAFIVGTLALSLVIYGLRPWPWYSSWVERIAFNDTLTTCAKAQRFVHTWHTYAWLVVLVIAVVVYHAIRYR